MSTNGKPEGEIAPVVEEVVLHNTTIGKTVMPDGSVFVHFDPVPGRRYTVMFDSQETLNSACEWLMSGNIQIARELPR